MSKNNNLLSVVGDKAPSAVITEREQCYRAMFEAAMFGMVMYRPDGALINCNRAFLEIIGYSGDDIACLGITDIIPQDYRKQAIRRLRILKEKGRYGPYKGEYIDKNGQTVTVWSDDVLIEGAGGQNYIFSSVLDIIKYPKAKRLESRLSLISQSVENAFNAFSIVNDQGQFIYVNTAHVRLWGYDSVAEVIGLSPATHFADPDTAQKIIEQTIRNGHCELEFKARRKDGSLFCALLHAKLGHDVDGREIYIASCIDISPRKETERELLKLQRAVESSSSAVIITDTLGVIEYVNPKFTQITGYEKFEALGQQPAKILLSSKISRTKAHYEMWRTISAGKEWSGVLRNTRKDGGLYWSKNSISSVKDSKGVITHYITVHEDISEHYELSEKLTYQASHDTLTGLINRREFERLLQRVISTSKTAGTQHALCFMDMDQFKVINDTCGHIAGDELLRQIGVMLKRTVRKRDTIARLGGDEFAVLMEHCPPENAMRVANSLLEAVRGFQFGWKEYNFKLGISIGLVTIDNTIRSVTQLLSDADLACYMAKDQGRNRVHFYHEKDTGIIERHGQMQWVSRINKALDEDRFCLYAQPILSMNGAVKHYELLIRMLDERGNAILPGAFLPAAERYGLIVKLDHWIIKHAFSLLAQHPKLTEASNLYAINVSGPSLADPATLDLIVEWLNEYQLSGKNICFEITETAAITNLSAAKRFIETLKFLGCRFALDDFGSGLSSFAYLKKLPVNYLKIDGMFIRGIADEQVDFAMVKSINEIGQVMGMQTIAEFVENKSIKSKVEEIGINYAQGHEIGEPVELMRLIES